MYVYTDIYHCLAGLLSDSRCIFITSLEQNLKLCNLKARYHSPNIFLLLKVMLKNVYLTHKQMSAGPKNGVRILENVLERGTEWKSTYDFQCYKNICSS